jgi:hypothetical protein
MHLLPIYQCDMSETLTISTMLGCIAYSLWVRRGTFHCYWENCNTICIGLQGVAAILIIPQNSIIERGLHYLTGQWNLDVWLGHMCFMFAIGACLLHTMTRLTPPAGLQKIYCQTVQLPITLTVTLTLAALWESPAADAPNRDITVAAGADVWLQIYWLLLTGTMAYLLVLTALQFVKIRRDRRSRCYANFYLGCIAVGITSCVIRIATILVADPSGASHNAKIMWFCTCGAASLQSLIAARSWRRRSRAYRYPPLTEFQEDTASDPS